VNLTPACVSVLLDYLNERKGTHSERLFLTVRNHNPFAPQDLRKLIRSTAKRAKITKRVYPHLMRHSLATNMLHRGANLLAIKEQLGHAFIETTMVYIHSAPERMRMEYRMFAPSYL
jgi:integrase/recombinase XerD